MGALLGGGQYGLDPKEIHGGCSAARGVPHAKFGWVIHGVM